MGVQALGKLKCCNCKKRKVDIFEIIEQKYFCGECYEKLGGVDFKEAMEEINGDEMWLNYQL